MEWAGPCPFTGKGNDRWHMWSGKDWWCCRKDSECVTCPGEPGHGDFVRWGWLSQLDAQPTVSAAKSNATPPPPIERVYEYADQLDGDCLDYLHWRGIRPDTARRYLMGKDGHSARLTIPNIVVNGKPRCYGIKKRWFPAPPEPWMDKYTSVPGTIGRSVFNWNRLVERAWDFALVVEGVLDAVLLDQLYIPAGAPFGGGGVWAREWGRYLAKIRHLLIVADNTVEGREKAERKRALIGRGILTVPPGGYKDLGEAWQGGEDILAWAKSVCKTGG